MDMIVEAEKLAQRVVDSLVTEVCYRSDLDRLHKLHDKQLAEPIAESEITDETAGTVDKINSEIEPHSTEVSHSFWKQRRRSAELMRLVLAADCSNPANIKDMQNIQRNIQRDIQKDDHQHIHEEMSLAGHGVERRNAEEGTNQHTNDMVVVPLDADLSFLRQLANSEDTPVHLLKELVKTCHVEIREALVDNTNVTVELLMILARDESCDVRYALAENHNIPKEVLEILSADDNPYVQYRAQCTLTRLNVGVKPAQVIQSRFGRNSRPLGKVAAV